jgi:hypothetical protein
MLLHWKDTLDEATRARWDATTAAAEQVRAAEDTLAAAYAAYIAAQHPAS